MQAISKARRLHSVLRSSMHLTTSRPLCAGDYEITESSLQQCRNYSPASAFPLFKLSGLVHKAGPSGMCGSLISTVQYSSEANTDTDGPTDAVKELYDKIIESVCSKRTMAPNSWTWAMIGNCKNHEDIKLLFDALHNLRMFRLSNLRIHDNFNCHLCQEVAKVCAHVGALDFGKKTLCKHNVYGLTPSVTSAHYLLLHAKEHKDTQLMVDVMKLLKRNGLPLQPGTADIVFRICYDVDKWDLLCKYAKAFIKAGVKFRRTTFDTWMEFAAKIGNVESIWETEKLRSECMKQHTLISAISCAKGFLLEGKPEEAAAIVNVLNKILSDEKKCSIAVEVEKLVREWPFEVIKRQKPEERKALAASLQLGIPAMVNRLSRSGLAVAVSVGDLSKTEDMNQ